MKMLDFFKYVIINIRKCWLLPVKFYRRFISPLKSPCCRFVPSCSKYAEDAVMIHGIFVGTCLAVFRIIRCNPFGGFGDDPVPEYGFFHWERFILKITKKSKM